MQSDYQFMVDFTLPETLTEKFLQNIPHQRAKVNRLFREGKLVTYSLSLENSKMWAVFNANSEFEVKEMISTLPLSEFMEAKVSSLTFFNSMAEEAPVFSMN